MSIFLVLGCFGYNCDDLILCKSVENNIFVLEDTNQKYHKIMDYFDKFGLFDRPIIDTYGVKNFITLFENDFNSFNEKIFSDKISNFLKNFFYLHKSCNLYLKLCLSFEKSKIEESSIVIQPINDSVHKNESKVDILKQIERINVIKKMKGYKSK